MINQISNLIESISNEFKIIDIKQFENKEYKLVNESYIINLLTNIKNNKNQDNYIFVLDSNMGLNHAKDSFGIIEKKTFNQNFSLNYIPMNSGFNEKEHKNDFIKYNNIQNEENYKKSIEKLFIDSNFIIEQISKLFEKKNIAINISLVNIINIDKLKKFENQNIKDIKLELNDLDDYELKEKIKDIQNHNNKKIELLQNNPNIILYQSAGNYVYNTKNYKEKGQLEAIIKIGTNNNYEFIKNISLMMNQLIEHKLANSNQVLEMPNCVTYIFKYIEKNINEFNFKNQKNPIKVDFNKFIDLYIKDYLANYESYDLLKKINHLKIDNIKIVEATNGEVIKDNYKIYKKFNKKRDLDVELEKDLSSLPNNLNYNLEETERLLDVYNKYKEDYPEIFKLNALGSFSTLQFHDTIGLKRGIDGQKCK